MRTHARRITWQLPRSTKAPDNFDIHLDFLNDKKLPAVITASPGQSLHALLTEQRDQLTAIRKCYGGACAVLWEPGSERRGPGLSAIPVRGPGRGPAQAGRPHCRSVLQVALLAALASSASPAPTARPPARTWWRSASSVSGARRLTSAPSAGAGSGALDTASHTTPDAVSVHRMLARLKAQGVREVAMEVSSHALDQGRVDGVRFHSAAFTNLTRDHLDYHPSMQAYGEAKARLFAAQDLQHMIINIGDAFGRELAMRSARPRAADGGLDRRRRRCVARRALRSHAKRPGARFARRVDGHRRKLRQAASLDQALGALQRRERAGRARLSAGARRAARSRRPARSPRARAPPGRMEVIEAAEPGKPMAVVDYAHTPDALGKALARACASIAAARSGACSAAAATATPASGPIMGAIADELADQIIVTDDNPRSENPAEIVRGHHAAASSRTVPRDARPGRRDRRRASERGGAADVVLIAGKGHEDYQIYGATRRSFSDRRRGAQSPGGRGMKRTLAGRGASGRRHARSARIGPTAWCRPTAARCRRARCSSRCAGPKFDGADFVAAAAGARGGRRAGRARGARRAAAADRSGGCARGAAAARTGMAGEFLDPDRRCGRKQRQDHREGDDRGDSVAPRCRAWRPTATSTITSACR